MEIEIKLDTSKTRKKGHPIIISIYITPTDRQYPTTGYYSSIEDWDPIRNEPRFGHPQYHGLYEFLYKKRIVINQILERKEIRTAEQIKKLILSDSRESFTEFWKNRIKELEELGKKGNARYFQSNLNSLNQFNENVNFNQINFTFLERYRDFHLKKVDKFGRKTVSPNGVIVYLRALRTVYLLAIKRKHFIPLDSTNHFDGIFPDADATSDKEFTLFEMRNIVEVKKKNKYYDIFILCFLFGGIDYVDLLNLKYDHIRNNRIKFERFKGGTKEIIDNFIFPEVWNILDKYKDETGYLMPLHIHESKSEKYSYRDNYVRRLRTWLKNEAGITTYCTSKTPRSTFSDIGKKLFLNRDVIKEIMGHSYKDIHSLYESRFSDEIRDKYHRIIIDAVLQEKEIN